MRTQTQGVVYATTGEATRGIVMGYHHKPSPKNLNKAKKSDIKGLKPKQKQSSIIEDLDDVESKFTIGFEVEKTELHRNSVREYELFCGFERDSSCGYEAVTHILPLLPAGTWRTKVFDMMHKAERIIDDRFSPSDKRCGGHITVGIEGLCGYEIKAKLRPFCGILLAMFRNRLGNTYCCGDKRMRESFGSKYQVAYAKGDVLEFRIPSRFDSVRQMMRRYELFYEMIDFAINDEFQKHDTFLKRIRPIILSMYNGNAEKVDEIMKLAKHFRKYIVDDIIHNDIRAFV